MRPAWGALPHLTRLAVVALLTVWCTVLSWRVLTEEFAAVSIPLLLVGAVVVGTGVAARVARMPAALVPVVQALVGGWLLVGVTTGSLAPTGDNVGAFRLAVEGAVESANQYAAPVGTDVAPVHPLLLGGALLVLLLVDLAVVGLRRVVLAALPLVGAYALGPLVTGNAVSWWVFALGGASFLTLLHLESSERTSRWGHGVAGETSGFSVRNGGVSSAASALGAGALALGVALPLAVPTLDVSFFEGKGPGSREVEVKNPMVDLRRDLRRGDNIPLLQVTTDNPSPSYLRLSVLTRFVDGRWTPGDREIPSNQAANGEMPGLDGVSTALNRTEYSYAVDAEPGFVSTWLPSMAQTTQIQAGTDWRYDLNTRDFIGARNDVTTADRNWSFRAVELEYDAEAMARATSGASAVRPLFTEVPSSVSNDVRRLAASVTADAPTRFQKAQVLQRWFRQDGGFRYDLNPSGSDEDDLDAFLDEDTGRVGYCEQFAASMAIMARVIGIPSRVAVGFLEPRRIGGDSWEYRAWDLHAWPELYFPGSGWVRFEPTPGARAESTPGYTTAELPELTALPSPSATRSSELLPERGQTPDATDEPEAGADDGSVLLPALLGSLALLALVALLAATPRLVRQARRRQRLEQGPEGIWDELRASVLDLGHRWPEGRSPRRTAQLVGSWLAAPSADGRRPDRPRRGRERAPEASAALDRLVEVMERSRYAREGSAVPTGAMQDDLEAVEKSLRAGVSLRSERRARWLPRSLTRVGAGRRQDGPVSREREDATTSPVDELVG